MPILNSIANFFSSSAGKGLGEIAGLGATGAGLAGNLAAEHQRSIAAKQAQANANLTPEQLAEQVKSATQPLNAGLVQAITGNVNANMAEQGLSQAPGLQATEIAQALAGPEQMNQQTALALVLKKLGLPAEFASTIPPNSNLAPLLAMLFKGGSPTATPLWQNQAPIGPPAPPPNTDQDTTGSYDFGNLFAPNSGGA
jgi:hypothetical protein